MAVDDIDSRVGGEVFADMLQAYGVTHIFMVPAILRRTLAEIERRHPSIARISTHGEATAVYMADGYARTSGRPGVCGAQVIGAMNLAAGLREPWLAHAPVIAFTGGREPKTKFRKVYQEIDDVPSFEQVTKFNATVDDAGRIPDMLRQAFRVATTGSPGPVHLQFRGNEGQVDQDTAAMDATVEAAYASIPPYRPVPADDSVAVALGHLQRAARPVIVAGGGVRASGAQATLVQLAEVLQIPVATSLNGRDSIPENHPLSLGVVGTYSRESANRVVNQADLVCFIGSETGGMTTNFWTVPPLGTAVVQIDIEPQNIGRNYPPVASVHGDARSVLLRMIELADPATAESRGSWLAIANAERGRWQGDYRAVMTSDDVPIRPERLCNDLTTLVPDNAIVVVDTGHAGMWMGQYFDLRSAEQSYLRSCGHLGWAYPAGLGAKCAAPERPVVVFTGDAGLYYHLGEIETAVRRKINTVTVVNNNAGGSQSRRGFDRAYGGEATPAAREMWEYEDIDFAQIGERMGAIGIRVDKPGELAPAIERALELDRPVIVDVRTDIEALAPPPVTT